MKRLLALSALLSLATAPAMAEPCSTTIDESGKIITFSRADDTPIYLNFAEHLVSDKMKFLVNVVQNIGAYQDQEIETYFSELLEKDRKLISEIYEGFEPFEKIASQSGVTVFAFESPEEAIPLRISQLHSARAPFTDKLSSLGFSTQQIDSILLYVFNKSYWYLETHPDVSVSTIALEKNLELLKNQSEYEKSFNVVSAFLSTNSGSMKKEILAFLHELNSTLTPLYETSYEESADHFQAATDLKKRIKKSKVFKSGLEKKYRLFLLSAIDNMVGYVKTRHSRDEQFAGILYAHDKAVISTMGAHHKTGVLYFLRVLCKR